MFHRARCRRASRCPRHPLPGNVILDPAAPRRDHTAAAGTAVAPVRHRADDARAGPVSPASPAPAPAPSPSAAAAGTAGRPVIETGAEPLTPACRLTVLEPPMRSTARGRRSTLSGCE